MGRIVVNKHFDVKSQITPESFAHKGELIISNQVGYEGIFIKNNNGEIFYIAPTEGTGADIPLEYKEYIETFVNGRLEGYITKDEFDELIKDVQIDPEQVKVIANEEITSALTVYSTTEDMNTAISNAIAAIEIPSIEGLASETWVKEQIAAAELDGEDVDLSIYATKEEIEENYATKGFVTSAISEIDLTAYVTKNEVSSYTISREEVRQISAEEVAKIVASADSSYDTLKEISDWILNDTTGAASMANDILNLKAQLNALTLGAKASASVNQSTITKGENTQIRVTGKMIPETLVPCTVVIKKGGEIVASADTNIVYYTETINDSASYKVEAVYNNVMYSASTSVNAYYRTYYGFGTDYNDVFTNGKSKLSSSAKGSYSDTAATDNVYYFIIVPDGVTKPNTFTMGGAPFNMMSSNVTVNGVNYTVYQSGSMFNNGGKVDISAS